MFSKNLVDIVKGLRSHQRDADAYVARIMGEIKTEVKSPDRKLKVQAVEKLVYVRAEPRGGSGLARQR